MVGPRKVRLGGVLGPTGLNMDNNSGVQTIHFKAGKWGCFLPLIGGPLLSLSQHYSWTLLRLSVYYNILISTCDSKISSLLCMNLYNKLKWLWYFKTRQCWNQLQESPLICRNLNFWIDKNWWFCTPHQREMLFLRDVKVSKQNSQIIWNVMENP